MNATELYQAGQLDEAIDALGAALRENPSDARRRTFLFELLCFAGRWDRAEKQLDVLAAEDHDAEMGALLYRGALHAERLRAGIFGEGGMLPSTAAAPPVAGTVNGTRYEAIRDADPRIGGRLELFVAGQYTWLPLTHVAAVRIEPPKRLRDLLWTPAVVQPAEEFREMELGEVLMPVLTPLAWRHAEPAVRLGRLTDFEPLAGGGEAPVGQKLLLLDDEELPILELRELWVERDEPA